MMPCTVPDPWEAELRSSNDSRLACGCMGAAGTKDTVVVPGRTGISGVGEDRGSHRALCC